jgi:hypothetical protein
VGEARICSHYYGKGLYDAYDTGPTPQREYRYCRAKRRLLITNLEIAGETWMVDDPPHWWAMLEHATYYSGHVLVAGLGLGLITHAPCASPQVTGITVVERSADVIALVQPLIPASVRVFWDDWYLWKPDFRPDGVFYDLFAGHGPDLITPAFRTMFEMRERFPQTRTFRIHGFNNDFLNRLADQLFRYETPMSRDKFDDNCPGCRPVLFNLRDS